MEHLLWLEKALVNSVGPFLSCKTPGTLKGPGCTIYR